MGALPAIPVDPADRAGAVRFALAKLLQSSSAVTIGVMNIDENDVDRRYFPEHHIPVSRRPPVRPVETANARQHESVGKMGGGGVGIDLGAFGCFLGCISLRSLKSLR